ncbi:MAG: pyridoxamine 5'-phosphate oxidase [Saprospiraceae bacterium]|nr:pyridoxamine 5'-phosphate oxidase [Saprospiraceae bacterium]
MKNIEDLRKSYHLGSLDTKDLTPDPLDLFRQWWHAAIEAEIDEANAMTLATVNEKGQPSARIVLLKGLHEDGLEFFTNYQSRKAIEMEENRHVALLFFWKEMERQVRIEGLVEKVTRERSEQYFQSRPRGSQVGAWSSPQTQVIPDRSVIENNIKETEEKYTAFDPLPLPDHWGGYLVKPHQYEFWQGKPDRLHDRFRFVQQDDGLWGVDRLAP